MRHIALIACFALCLPLAARAQTDWPRKPITMVVSNGAGSAPDVMARLLASRMEPLLGQSVIVENKAGASNVIGAMSVSKAPPDGYRLFFATSSALAANPFLTKNLPYDPLKDFKPIALTNTAHSYLLVHKDVPVSSTAEFIAADRKNPGSMAIGVDGPRNLAGIAGQALNHMAGAQFVLVAYPNIVNGLQDLVAGRIQAGIFAVAISQPFVDQGALRPIAVTALHRSNAHPQIPAVSEVLPGYGFSGWFMLMAPAGTADSIINRINSAVDKAMGDPQIIAMGPKLGYDFDSDGVGSPAQADAYLRQQIDYWRTITRDLNIAPE